MAETALPAHLAELPGTALTPGSIRIPSSEAAMLADVLDAPVPDAELHPVYAYVAAQRGIGVSVEELCSLADFPVEDGPMLGSVDLEYFRPLRPDTDYRVEGSIVDIVRKSGRTAGVFDLLSFEERVLDAAGDVLTAARISFVLPRKGADS